MFKTASTLDSILESKTFSDRFVFQIYSDSLGFLSNIIHLPYHSILEDYTLLRQVFSLKIVQFRILDLFKQF